MSQGNCETERVCPSRKPKGKSFSWYIERRTKGGVVDLSQDWGDDADVRRSDLQDERPGKTQQVEV
jgi:hypothetical protein